MSITNTTSRVTTIGDGVTTVWDYGFLLPDAASTEVTVTVIATGVVQVIDPSEYTLLGLTNPNGGTVEYPISGSPLASTSSISITRKVPNTQEISITNQTRYDAGVVETVWDRLTMQLQDNFRVLAKVFTVHEDYPASNPLIPEADKLLIWDSAGENVVAGPTAGNIDDAEANAAAAAVSAGEAVVSAGEASDSADAASDSAAEAAVAVNGYLPLTAGAGKPITGDLHLKSASPAIILEHTSAAFPWQIDQGSGENANFKYNGTTVYSYPVDGVMIADSHVATRAGGDVRWVGQTGTSTQNIENTSTGTVLILDHTGTTPSNLFSVKLAGVETYTLKANGNLNSVTAIPSRASGDGRWAAISSQRFKNRIKDSKVDPSLIDQLEPKTWTWGGEVWEGDVRYGQAGTGLIAEEVEALYPEAVTYRWVTEERDDPESKRDKKTNKLKKMRVDTDVREVMGLDALALISILVKELQDVRKRLALLEGAR